jgi:hypothetical protein
MFIPAFVLLVVAAVSLALYKNFWQLNLPYVQKAAAFIFGPAAFLAIGCGAIVVYPVCRSRGASVAEAFAASMITPLAWILKEVVRVSEFFSWGESLYYGLSSSLLLAIAANIGFMGLGEMIHRRRLKKRGRAGAVVTPVPIAAVVFALAALYVILIWGVGVHWFYIYQEGYKAIFH